VLVGKPPELVGKPPELVGKPPELVGKPPELVGKPPELDGKPPELDGKPPEPKAPPPVSPPVELPCSPEPVPLGDELHAASTQSALTPLKKSPGKSDRLVMLFSLAF
jgi:hypothetical protein